MSDRPQQIMEMKEVAPGDRPMVTGYRDSGFSIGDRQLEGGLLLLPERYLTIAPAVLEDVDETTLAPVLETSSDIEILLLGGGAKLRFPPQLLKEMLEAAGVAIEPMDSPAAARTFNMLVAEERRVAALLLPVGEG